MSLDLDLIYSDFNFTMDKLSHPEIYEFEKFRLDAVHLMLYREDEEIPLAPKAVETLLALVVKRGEIVSKDELIKAIWTDSIVEESNLAKYLHVLRKTLGNQKNGKPFIETFRRRGYRFNGAVSGGDLPPEAKPEKTNQTFTQFHAPTNGGAIREATTGKVVALADWRGAAETDEKLPETISPAAPEEAKEFPATDRKKFPFVPAAIGVGLLILALGFFAFTRYRSALETPTTDAPITAVAVLPFENGSNDANLDYLSDGLSESVIDRLSELPQLKVISRSSSFKYRGGNLDLSDVARKLGAQAIVMGKVVQRGDNLSIRVELIDTRENVQLWGEQFDRKGTDAPALQREIAQTVLGKLRLKLSGAQEQKLTKQDTLNPHAYDLLIKGQFLSRKGDTENLKKALEFYRQATAADPNYALAYARLSLGYQSLIADSTFDPKEFMPKAQAAAQKALELDENLAEAHFALALFHLDAWDWAAVEQRFKRAVELNPNSNEAHRRFAYYLMIMGRYEQALAVAKRAGELDPFSLDVKARVGTILIAARRYDEALAEAKEMLELDKNFIKAHRVLGWAYRAKGMFREAVSSLQESIRLGDKSSGTQIYLGAAYAQTGEREKAQAILRQLETSKEYVSLCELAVLYAALGEREKAFESLGKAYVTHDLHLQFLKADPAYEPLRNDPRFQDLVRRVGLPQ